jgi:hypothetical protein
MSLRLPLVLEEIDPETGCIARDWQLGSVDVLALGKLVCCDFSEIDRARYDLDHDDVRLISMTFLTEPLDFQQGMLRPRHPFLDALPYKIHTNRELAMMLQGDKPFARFSMYQGEDFETIVRQPFAKHVATGVLLAFVETADRGFGTITTYSFTLPGEEWRVAAMNEVWETGRRTGWNDDLERREGQLLGYKDWQNDAFLKLRHEMLERASAE